MTAAICSNAQMLRGSTQFSLSRVKYTLSKISETRNNLNRFSDEGGLVVRDDAANDNLEREPSVADTLDVEERRVRFLSLFFQTPRRRPSCSLVGWRGARRGVIDIQCDVT